MKKYIYVVIIKITEYIRVLKHFLNPDTNFPADYLFE